MMNTNDLFDIAALVGTGFVLVYLLWFFFIAVMNIKRVSDVGKLSRFATVLSYPIVIVGVMIDAATNWLVFTFVLLELPQEITVTARLKRHHRESIGWRLAVVLILEPILDPFDPSGDHV
jgi:hypothetical protein